METQSTVVGLATHLVKALSPLGELLSRPDYFRSYLYRIGWEVDAVPAAYTRLQGDIRQLQSALEAVTQDQSPPNVAALLKAITACVQKIQAIDEVPAGLHPEAKSAFLESFKGMFLDVLLSEYILNTFPEVYNLGRLLGIIDVQYQPPGPGRTDYVKTQLHLNQIPAIIRNPLQLPQRIYGWNTMQLNFNLLIQHLDELLHTLGISSYLELDDGTSLRSLNPAAGAYAPYKLVLSFYLGYIDTTPIELRLELVKWPAQNGNPPGIAALLGLPTALTKAFQLGEDAELTFSTVDDADILLGFILQPRVLDVVTPRADAGALFQQGITIGFDYHPETPIILLGATDTSGLDLKATSLQLALKGPGPELLLRLELRELFFHLNAAAGDSFLRKITGGRSVEQTFSLSLEWSSTRGINFATDGRFEWQLPTRADLGFATLEGLLLSIQPDAGTIPVFIQTNVVTSLGPLLISVQNIGLQGTFAFPDGYTGNLGPIDLDLGFKPPVGLGLAVDARAITGGGFLSFDPARGEYSGAAQLTFKNKIHLKAFGSLLTQLPGQPDGYSFLLLISSEFPAVPLGLGFKLTGVGGLIGIHRRVELARLTQGLRTNEFDDVLFPSAPLQNPYGLLQKTSLIFPVADGQYVFGLMGQIVWGADNLVTIEVGLILEFPDPVRLALIGVLRAVVSKKITGEERTILRLQVNFAGTLNFEQRFIRFDAALFESTLLGLKLEGDLALRIRYGTNADFALSVGGFHPDFQPPALDLPAQMRRLQITLREGNPLITVSAYVAVTANTFQFGVAGRFQFDKWGVRILGQLSFDALFQFNPFRFEVGVYFLLSASWHGYEFAAIEINGVVAGPSPWFIEGKLRLKVWIFSKTVHFEETWGEGDESRLESVHVLPLLAEDLRLPNNWESAPGRSRTWVTIRRSPPATGEAPPLAVHPNEVLSIRQNTVPLGLTIDKFGERRPQGAVRFRLELTGTDQVALAGRPVRSHFAPAQFLHLSDEQKLRSPAYEPFDAGLGFDGLDTVALSAFMTSEAVRYEPRTVDVEGVAEAPSPPRPIPETDVNFRFSLLNNAIANAAAARRPRPVQPAAARTWSEKYAVVWQHDLTTYQDLVADSEAEARQWLRDLTQADPARRAELTIVLRD